MKYARRISVVFYILLPVFLLLSLCGCERAYYRRDYNRDYRHYYHDGRWYERDSAGHEILVAALAIGALIDSLPPRHEVVVVEGNQYYHDDRYYYRHHPNGGYVVVPAPVVVKSHSRNYQERRGGERDRNY